MKDTPLDPTGTGAPPVVAPVTPAAVAVPDAAAGVLGAVRGARRREYAATAEQLRLACAWADLHPAESIHDAAAWTIDGVERAVPLAGDGTPLVAEFCVAELTTALGLSPDAGRTLLGEALELRHRLPKVWARVQALEVPAWRARRIARATQTLSAEAAGFVDAQIAHVAHRVGPAGLERLVEEAIGRFHPDLATQQRAEAAEARCFHVNHDQVSFTGTSTVYGVLDLADALDLDAAVTARAGLLAALGSSDTLDVRRAAAVGEIARADLTLDLHTETPEGLDGRAQARLRRARRDTTLVVHLSADALAPARTGGGFEARLTPHTSTTDSTSTTAADGGDPAVVEERTRSVSLETSVETPNGSTNDPTGRGFEARLTPRTSTTEVRARTSTTDATAADGGTVVEERTRSVSLETSLGDKLGVGRVEHTRTLVTVEQIRDWLAVDGTRVMVRPVLDLDQQIHVAQYEIPDRLTDQTRLRDATCVFPWCERPARRCDVDHVIAHAEGGQTATDNTACLCRRHHRLKTFGHWRYRVLEPGSYLWTSPHGYQYLRDHTGTRDLTVPATGSVVSRLG